MVILKSKRFFNYSDADGSYIDYEDIKQDYWTLEIEGKEYYANPAFSTDIEPLEPKEGFKVCFNQTLNAWEYKQLKQENKVTEENPDLKKYLTVLSSYKEISAYLNSTDWYTSRFVETGEPIPEEIKIKRAEARIKISKLRSELETLRQAISF